MQCARRACVRRVRACACIDRPPRTDQCGTDLAARRTHVRTQKRLLPTRYYTCTARRYRAYTDRYVDEGIASLVVVVVAVAGAAVDLLRARPD